MQTVKIDKLIPDAKNANKGTDRGRKALLDSLKRYGGGRSVLLDKDGRIIAGNKTVAAAAGLGIEDVIIVQTDGKQIVAVQRTDLDIDSPEGRGLAIADNRVGELDLSWDVEQLMENIRDGADLTGLFDDNDLSELLASMEAGDADYLGVPKDAKPNPRKFGLDAIYTTTFPASCCLAVNSGFKIGIQSTKEPCPCVLCGKQKLTFADRCHFLLGRR